MAESRFQILHTGWTKIADFERRKPTSPTMPEVPEKREKAQPKTNLYSAIENNEVVEFHYIFYDQKPLCVYNDKVFEMIANTNPSQGYDLRETTSY